MKTEKKKTIIFIFVAVIVLVGVYFLSNAFVENYVEEISYDEYKALIKDDNKNYVFTGNMSTSIRTELNTYGKTNEETIYYLDVSKLTEEEKKEIGYENDSLSTFEKSEEESKYEVKLTSVTLDEYLKLIKEKGNHFMFIGRETCSYCVKFKEEISKAQLFNNFDVYYLDIDTILSEDLQKLYASDTYFNENEDWGTPLNFLYVDGKRVGELPGYVSSTELISFLTEHNVLEEK